MLRLESVSKSFGGVRAVDRLDLSVGRGELVGLIGPNGSGKTTLLNCITRIYTPAAGQILFAGRDIMRLAPFELARMGETLDVAVKRIAATAEAVCGLIRTRS